MAKATYTLEENRQYLAFAVASGEISLKKSPGSMADSTVNRYAASARESARKGYDAKTTKALARGLHPKEKHYTAPPVQEARAKHYHDKPIGRLLEGVKGVPAAQPMGGSDKFFVLNTNTYSESTGAVARIGKFLPDAQVNVKLIDGHGDSFLLFPKGGKLTAEALADLVKEAGGFKKFIAHAAAEGLYGFNSTPFEVKGYEGNAEILVTL